jgi:polysaccharide deacetylase 2 family uncharacterized protein YibQ
MTADHLSAPLGQGQLKAPPKRRRKFPFDLHAAMKPKKPEQAAALDAVPSAGQASGHNEGPANGPAVISVPASQGGAAGNTKTVTIIDGKTGEGQEVVIPAAGNSPGSVDNSAPEQKFVEMTSHGPVPKIAADGVRPAEAFARPVKPLPNRPDAPRVALIVGGLGISANVTADAIAKLPGAVTLAFMPYSSDVARQVARARGEGHEILLQAPMEPVGYPENDSGPQTLLTSLTPEQNLDRLYWMMSRFQGYVGVIGAMGARFTASETAFSPVLRETAKHGLIFVDDGSNPRSVAGRVAGANNLPFAKADIILDSVATSAEIDHALGRLEMAARERGVAVGVSSALPASIEQIAKWAKGAESRGLLLVPITAVALKAKQS